MLKRTSPSTGDAVPRAEKSEDLTVCLVLGGFKYYFMIYIYIYTHTYNRILYVYTFTYIYIYLYSVGLF